MAKKKAKKKSKPAARYKAKPKSPRSQVLPGMERVRDGKLDQYCEDANDGLGQITAGTAAVDDAKSAALGRMRSRGMSSYVHAGVRFTLNPGIDKIAVKRIKEKEATAAVFSQTPTDAGEEIQRRDGDVDQGDDDVDGDLSGAEIH